MTETIDKIVLAAAAVCAALGTLCVGWAFYLEALFLLRGPDAEFMIGAFGCLVFGALPSLGAAIAAFALGNAVRRTTSLVLYAPAALTALSWLTGLLLDHYAYSSSAG